MSCREKPGWCPSRWKPARVRRFVKHVRNVSEVVICADFGAYAACVFLADFNAALGSSISRAELHARGVKTLGDTDGNTSAKTRE